MDRTLSGKVMVFTDLHFGIHSNSQSYMEICSDTLRWLSGCCSERGISEVLFMGDFFDSRASIDVRTLNSATQSLYALADGGVSVTMVLGNHDIYLRDSTSIHSLLAFGGRSGIRIVDKPERIAVGGTPYTAMLLPWMYGTAANRVEVPKGLKYVFSHHNYPSNFFMGGAFSKKKNRSDTFSSPTPYEDEYGIQQGLLEAVVDNGGVFFSGHVHQRKEIPLKNGASMVIEGSPYETSWGFGGVDCGAYVVDFSKGTYEFLANPFNRKHVEIRTSSAESDMGGVDFPNSIVRLTVDTQEPFDTISKLQAKIGSMKPFSVESTKYEFEVAEFVPSDASPSPSDVAGGKVSSKLDYVMSAIDKADFSAFAYLDGGETKAVDRERLKKIAADIYEKSGTKG